MTPSPDTLCLLPPPRACERRGPGRVLKPEGLIGYPPGPEAVEPIARRLQSALIATKGVSWPLAALPPEGRGTVRYALDPGASPHPQGYRLQINRQGIVLAAPAPAGLFHATHTLVQILRQCPGELPGLVIEDAPDFEHRGVMLDISRDKVPSQDSLKALIEELAALKINHLELYMEHTFAYRDHREVWEHASPLTAEDIRELDAWCRDRFIELVPNQNCFGHLERWLVLPRYRDLAECPDGFELPWGGRRETPFSLNPTDPRSLELVAGWLVELLPNFSSRRVNVGGDETFDLGQGRSREHCEQRGKGRVYLDFLLSLHALTGRLGRTMHFWGDIIIQHPERVSELPRDVVVLEWGYEANHPFPEHAARFAASGLPFYVCPGTSSWNSFSGRTDNMLANIRLAAEEGRRHAAAGLLNTDWGDNGHLQYLPASWPGFAWGAAQSWSVAASASLDLARALDLHVFHDAAGVLGRLVMDLGNTYRTTVVNPSNSTTLFQIVNRGWNAPLPQGLERRGLDDAEAWIGRVMEPLARARPAHPDGALLADELRNTARMLLHACHRAQAALDGRTGNSAVRRGLAAEVGAILEAHRRLWRARNRIGGLQDSTRLLDRCLAEYTA